MLVVVIVALGRWHPGAIESAPPTPTITPLPDDFTLIPAFTPSFACELHNAHVYDADRCRNERITERALAQGIGVSFIEHTYIMSTGCWGSISRMIRELHVCQLDSGATRVLTPNLVTALVPSPDGTWFAYGTMNSLGTDGDALRPHIYRVKADGTTVQSLDAGGFPDFAVGAPGDLRWLDTRGSRFRCGTARPAAGMPIASMPMAAVRSNRLARTGRNRHNWRDTLQQRSKQL